MTFFPIMPQKTISIREWKLSSSLMPTWLDVWQVRQAVVGLQGGKTCLSVLEISVLGGRLPGIYLPSMFYKISLMPMSLLKNFFFEIMNYFSDIFKNQYPIHM